MTKHTNNKSELMWVWLSDGKLLLMIFQQTIRFNYGIPLAQTYLKTQHSSQ